MTKFKVFFGTCCCGPNSIPADEKANKWISEHPSFEILSFEYQQARYGDHSICIAYREPLEVNHD